MEQFLIKARKNDFTTCSFDSFSSFKFIFIGLLLIPHEADGLHRRLVLDPPQSLPIRCAIHILPLLSPGWGKIKSNWCRLNNSAQVFVTRPHFVSAPGELVHSVARPRFIINSSSSSLIWNPSLRQATPIWSPWLGNSSANPSWPPKAAAHCGLDLSGPHQHGGGR